MADPLFDLELRNFHNLPHSCMQTCLLASNFSHDFLECALRLVFCITCVSSASSTFLTLLSAHSSSSARQVLLLPFSHTRLSHALIRTYKLVSKCSNAVVFLQQCFKSLFKLSSNQFEYLCGLPRSGILSNMWMITCLFGIFISSMSSVYARDSVYLFQHSTIVSADNRHSPSFHSLFNPSIFGQHRTRVTSYHLLLVVDY